MGKLKKEFSKNKFFFLLSVLVLPVILSFLRTGFFLSDDGEWMIIRFSAFHQELVKGQFPVRFLQRLNNGYGYPVATFLYPGFMYLAEIPKILGFGFVNSVKIVFIVSVFFALFFSFLWLKAIFGPKAAVLGSLIYIYNPYFLWDIYKRGSVGEVLALGVVPLVLWAMERKNYPATSIGFGLLILAHNTLALLFIPVLLIYAAMLRRLPGSVVSLLLGLGTSAFFWLPAIFELKYTVFSEVVVSNWQDYFLEIKNLPLLGWFNLVLALMAVILLLKDKLFQPTAVVLIGLSFLGVFLATSVSAFIWGGLPLGRFVQFPFRFLSWGVLGSSYLAAFIVKNLKKEGHRRIILIGGLLMILTSLAFAKPKKFINKEDSYYATNEATTTVADEYLPHWVKVKPRERAKQRIERIDKETIQINTVYWPGWRILVNGKEKKIDYSNEKGLMRVKAKEEEGEVKALFTETPLRLVADFISLGSFLVIFYFLRRQLYVS